MPASERDGAGMRRHVHAGNHAAESFVSFIPLLCGAAASLDPLVLVGGSLAMLAILPQRMRPPVRQAQAGSRYYGYRNDAEEAPGTREARDAGPHECETGQALQCSSGQNSVRAPTLLAHCPRRSSPNRDQHPPDPYSPVTFDECEVRREAQVEEARPRWWSG